MKKFGEVKAILDERLLLITSSERLAEGQIVTVLAELQDPRIAQSAGIASVVCPKGELRVICPQEGDVYLVERFREFRERRQKVTVASPLQKALQGLAAHLQPETKEFVEEVPGPWSAEIDKDAAFGISPSMIVRVGDPVGKV